MHTLYYPDRENWGAFLDDEGQFGAGAPAYTYFQGTPFYQRGEGIGAILRSVWRFLKPLGLEMGEALRDEGIRTGSRVLNNLVAGQPVREALKTQTRAGLKNILDTASSRLAQGGSGKRRTLRPALYAARKEPPRKRRGLKKDALGYY